MRTHAILHLGKLIVGTGRPFERIGDDAPIDNADDDKSVYRDFRGVIYSDLRGSLAIGPRQNRRAYIEWSHAGAPNAIVDQGACTLHVDRRADRRL